MFGIGGGELVFIMFVALMLFGSDKIPDIARTMGKAMAQLKNATNDIKSEIQRGAESNDIDIKSLTGDFTSEIDKVKQGFNKIITDNTSDSLGTKSITDDITSEIEKIKENLDDLTGPIKRQL
ncbi:twin-arginine translocase TatA/TatE family subunit [Flavobacterium psychrophilum]|uniref:Sec-independent protein translocase subunit TatA/TatB n=1 Tax=Flavobacterium psychrophilum TaxID=96345 RepID=UPI000B7C1366|nr:twin-arginine translocase TatA/TatE family subunit [Flavobacterium psychrophilum]EKT4552244.1 twin-arginine translocase TatA/TatE family subunit [Flavobacterium psychrophilum]ELY1977990.1 twin-arginine translocase TatA/TatE family subunit [Flavobacterium psychrophilum]SNB14646.1 putative Sec-independent protein translocase (Twin-arginine translocation protein) [Flavobacterium psychrophilum]